MSARPVLCRKGRDPRRAARFAIGSATGSWAGQSLRKLGDSGDTSAPHLHFHVMDGPPVLGSNGLPFLIESYLQSGQITDAMFGAAGIGSDLSAAISSQPAARASSLPLDSAALDFPN